MIHELVIISGKGGTGKTTVAASIAALACPVVLADCDVDGPDLHLLTSPKINRSEVFIGGKKAFINPSLCCGCGRCVQMCRFNAVYGSGDNGIVSMTYQVDPLACEGCGACVRICPAGAIGFESVENGKWFISETRFGSMIHARLHPGEENSGKLVSLIRREARLAAEQEAVSLIVSDGSPGMGCSVIASLVNADMALIVAEPTLSGVHDARRVMDLVLQMRIRSVLCVNRWEINSELTMELESDAMQNGILPVGRIGNDLSAVDAQLAHQTMVEWPCSKAADDIRQIWSRVSDELIFTGASISDK